MPVGDLQQDVGALGGGGLAPLVGGGMGGVERQLDVFGGRAGGLGVDLAVDRRDDVEVLALDRGDPLAADEVVVLGLVGDLGAGGAGGCVEHVVSLWMMRISSVGVHPTPGCRRQRRTHDVLRCSAALR